jgi:DUF1365 family protein
VGEGIRETFDAVVLACRSDQALAVLGEEASVEERAVLEAVRYQPNRALLHSDPALLPRRRARSGRPGTCLAGADAPTDADGEAPVAVSYLMDRLQPLPFQRPVVVTLNPFNEPDPALTWREIHYSHPVFDAGAIAAQARLPRIQGCDRVWFAGAWTGYGFHRGRPALGGGGGAGARRRAAVAGGRQRAMRPAPLRLLPAVGAGAVMHQRHQPWVHRFSYPTRFLRMPLSQWDTLRVPGLGIDRRVCSDFTAATTARATARHCRPGSVRDSPNAALPRCAIGEVCLQTCPRVFGFVFNPVSFWLCHDRDGRLRAALAEVNNTFGEGHDYLGRTRGPGADRAGDELPARKVFHVSPFFAVQRRVPLPLRPARRPQRGLHRLPRPRRAATRRASVAVCGPSTVSPCGAGCSASRSSHWASSGASTGRRCGCGCAARASTASRRPRSSAPPESRQNIVPAPTARMRMTRPATDLPAFPDTAPPTPRARGGCSSNCCRASAAGRSARDLPGRPHAGLRPWSAGRTASRCMTLRCSATPWPAVTSVSPRPGWTAAGASIIWRRC